MIYVVKVISSTLDEMQRRVVKFFRLGNSDVATSKEASPFGIDSVPINDIIALSVKTATKGETFVVGYLNKKRLAEIGETRLFSTDDSGDLKTYLWLKNDGTMHIGGDSDNMVRYSGLESAYNQLRTDLNNFISKYNSHVHPVSGSATGTTPQIETPSTADISGAKIDEIKTL